MPRTPYLWRRRLADRQKMRPGRRRAPGDPPVKWPQCQRCWRLLELRCEQQLCPFCAELLRVLAKRSPLFPRRRPDPELLGALVEHYEAQAAAGKALFPEASAVDGVCLN